MHLEFTSLTLDLKANLKVYKCLRKNSLTMSGSCLMAALHFSQRVASYNLQLKRSRRKRIGRKMEISGRQYKTTGRFC